MKINNKISISLFVIVLVLTATTSIITYIMYKNILQERIYAHLQTTAKSRANHIETYLEQHKGRIEMLASNILLKNALNEINNNRADITKTVETASDELKEAIRTGNYFYEIFVINPEGKIIFSTNEGSIGLDKSADAYFLGGKERAFIKDAYQSETTKKGAIAISAPVLDDEAGELLGVVVASSGLAGLNKITTDRTGLGKTGELYLLNKYGYMISPSRFIEDTFLKQKVDTINVKNCLLSKEKKNTHMVAVFPDYRGVSVLGTHQYIPEMGWALLAEIDEKEALAPLVKVKFIFISIMFFIPLAAWLLGSLISRRITRPIYELQEGTRIIGQGNLNHKVKIQTNDEIGQLAVYFNKMTQDLKELSQEFQTLLNAIPDSLILVSPDMKVLWANAATKKAVKNEFKESSVVCCQNLWNDSCLNCSDCPARKSFCSGQEESVQRTTSEGRIMEMRAFPVKDELGEVKNVILLSIDITEKVNFQTEALRAAHLASIGELAAGVAHEINNPVNAILLNAQFARKKSSVNGEGNKYLEAIINSCNRVSNIVQTLLSFARTNGDDRKSFKINEALDDTLKFSQYSLQKDRINLIIDIPEDLPAVTGSCQKLEQVFLNLINNARYALNEKYCNEDEDKILWITAGEAGANGDTHIEIIFHDQGTGMSDEVIQNARNPFYTTKPANSGTGLGLSISHSIISEYGGTLAFESREKEYTKIIINLPAGDNGK